jgi:23S rRNA (cytidine1920-2'-O)/16S rRNA (cytidine1409-2'-O)-methyltransferase
VIVAGVAAPKPSTLVSPADALTLAGEATGYVGRGGEKLEAALDRFSIEVSDRTAIDVGASTGGFTDCLLQRGARAVAALDVGYGQLHWRLRSDARVTVIERTNIRLADPGDLGAPFDLVVADLSFISLRTVASNLAALGDGGSDWVLLVKPQFEVGRTAVPKGGVVRDPEEWARAIRGVRDAFAGADIASGGVVRSPIAGAAGNVEFLMWGRRTVVPGVTDADIAAVVGSEG